LEKTDVDEGEGREAVVVLVGCDEGKDDRELYHLEYYGKKTLKRMEFTCGSVSLQFE
jgi:hypothetical protein